MFKKGHKPYIVTQIPRCKPPVDCFKCKYNDCIAGENRRPNAEETAFFEAGFGDRRKSCERK